MTEDGVAEMERRYQLMAALGVRNIAGYNDRVSQARGRGEIVTRRVQTGFDGETGLTLSVPFVRGVTTHGTGCAYSAAITGYLALGLPLAQAVEMAKNHITQAIGQSVRAGDIVVDHGVEIGFG